MIDKENNIENLKRTLLSLERQADSTRKQIQTLLRTTEERRCMVEIFWNEATLTYTTRFSRGGETLHSFATKRSTRSLASVGIERANGLRPRVSWKDIDAGRTWKADAILHDWYWQKYIVANKAAPAKVIDLNVFRALLQK